MGFLDRILGKEQGPRCVSCHQKVEGRDRIMMSQSIAVQAGLSHKAREAEKHQGYVCRGCGNLYCKSCLESRVSDPQRGASCPNCGGSFGYLP